MLCIYDRCSFIRIRYMNCGARISPFSSCRTNGSCSTVWDCGIIRQQLQSTSIHKRLSKSSAPVASFTTTRSLASSFFRFFNIFHNHKVFGVFLFPLFPIFHNHKIFGVFFFSAFSCNASCSFRANQRRPFSQL